MIDDWGGGCGGPPRGSQAVCGAHPTAVAVSVGPCDPSGLGGSFPPNQRTLRNRWTISLGFRPHEPRGVQPQILPIDADWKTLSRKKQKGANPPQVSPDNPNHESSLTSEDAGRLAVAPTRRSRFQP